MFDVIRWLNLIRFADQFKANYGLKNCKN